MKIQVLLAFLLSALMYSCSCEKEEETEKLSGPALSADRFYKAFTAREFEEAASYADKSTKRTLEFISYWSDGVLEMDFIKVDSCDQYEKHAYCYCKFKDKDSTEVIDKLLVRLVEEEWLVHYEEGGNLLGENVLYDASIRINNHAPESLPEMVEEVESDAIDISRQIISTINQDDFVVDFFPAENLGDLDGEVEFESDYEDNFYRWDYLELNSVKYKYEFAYDDKLSSYQVTIVSTDYDFLIYQRLIELLINEYGTPYNAKNINVKDLFRYVEVKWLVKGFNEELIISKESGNVIISLYNAI